MATAFSRTIRGRFTAQTEPAERAVLLQLLDEMCAMLDADALADETATDPLARELGLADFSGVDVETPADPVLRRLLPDAYSGDEEASREFRRLTDGSLRQGKVSDARRMSESLRGADSNPKGKISLTRDDAQAWCRAINDLRLALGTRLKVSADHYPDPTELDDNDPEKIQAAVYDFLTWWQDSLVRAMMPTI
ncbi:MAG: DUF2017 domain-containing protein [Candidatus Nanopelagicales bacterium]|nr:DUF2017 domain-containing protein [Candidatus Nanopelagicales bacterium]